MPDAEIDLKVSADVKELVAAREEMQRLRDAAMSIRDIGSLRPSFGSLNAAAPIGVGGFNNAAMPLKVQLVSPSGTPISTTSGIQLSSPTSGGGGGHALTDLISGGAFAGGALQSLEAAKLQRQAGPLDPHVALSSHELNDTGDLRASLESLTTTLQKLQGQMTATGVADLAGHSIEAAAGAKHIANETSKGVSEVFHKVTASQTTKTHPTTPAESKQSTPLSSVVPFPSPAREQEKGLVPLNDVLPFLVHARETHQAEPVKTRATGGSVGVNQPFIVGEMGPEVFVPPGPGRIIPSVKQAAEQGYVAERVPNRKILRADATSPLNHYQSGGTIEPYLKRWPAQEQLERAYKAFNITDYAGIYNEGWEPEPGRETLRAYISSPRAALNVLHSKKIPTVITPEETVGGSEEAVGQYDTANPRILIAGRGYGIFDTAAHELGHAFDYKHSPWRYSMELARDWKRLQKQAETEGIYKVAESIGLPSTSLKSEIEGFADIFAALTQAIAAGPAADIHTLDKLQVPGLAKYLKSTMTQYLYTSGKGGVPGLKSKLIKEGGLANIFTPEYLANVKRFQSGGYYRMYHGTYHDFDKPDPKLFDSAAMYGPGYYLTNELRVAGGIIANKDEYIAPPGPGQRHVGDVIRPGYAQGGFHYQGDPTGALMRAVDVPNDMRLWDADAIADKKFYNKLMGRVQSRLFAQGMDDVKTPSFVPNMTGDWWYRTASYLTSERQANKILAGMGYEGIRYKGGTVTPMYDELGMPITHNVNVIFPKALKKLINAISKTPGGQSGASTSDAILVGEARPEVFVPKGVTQQIVIPNLPKSMYRDTKPGYNVLSDLMSTLNLWPGAGVSQRAIIDFAAGMFQTPEAVLHNYIDRGTRTSIQNTNILSNTPGWVGEYNYFRNAIRFAGRQTPENRRDTSRHELWHDFDYAWIPPNLDRAGLDTVANKTLRSTQRKFDEPYGYAASKILSDRARGLYAIPPRTLPSNYALEGGLQEGYAESGSSQSDWVAQRALFSPNSRLSAAEWFGNPMLDQGIWRALRRDVVDYERREGLNKNPGAFKRDLALKAGMDKILEPAYFNAYMKFQSGGVIPAARSKRPDTTGLDWATFLNNYPFSLGVSPYKKAGITDEAIGNLMDKLRYGSAGLVPEIDSSGMWAPHTRERAVLDTLRGYMEAPSPVLHNLIRHDVRTSVFPADVLYEPSGTEYAGIYYHGGTPTSMGKPAIQIAGLQDRDWLAGTATHEAFHAFDYEQVPNTADMARMNAGLMPRGGDLKTADSSGFLNAWRTLKHYNQGKWDQAIAAGGAPWARRLHGIPSEYSLKNAKEGYADFGRAMSSILRLNAKINKDFSGIDGWNYWPNLNTIAIDHIIKDLADYQSRYPESAKVKQVVSRQLGLHNIFDNSWLRGVKRYQSGGAFTQRDFYRPEVFSLSNKELSKQLAGVRRTFNFMYQGAAVNPEHDLGAAMLEAARGFFETPSGVLHAVASKRLPTTFYKSSGLPEDEAVKGETNWIKPGYMHLASEWPQLAETASHEAGHVFDNALMRFARDAHDTPSEWKDKIRSVREPGFGTAWLETMNKAALYQMINATAMLPGHTFPSGYATTSPQEGYAEIIRVLSAGLRTGAMLGRPAEDILTNHFTDISHEQLINVLGDLAQYKQQFNVDDKFKLRLAFESGFANFVQPKYLKAIGSYQSGGDIDDGNSWGDIFKSIGSDFSMGAQMAMFMPAPRKREQGGPVNTGEPYDVGEKGRELFVPSQPGIIVPTGRRSLWRDTRGRFISSNTPDEEFTQTGMGFDFGANVAEVELQRTTAAVKNYFDGITNALRGFRGAIDQHTLARQPGLIETPTQRGGGIGIGGALLAGLFGSRLNGERANTPQSLLGSLAARLGGGGGDQSDALQSLLDSIAGGTIRGANIVTRAGAGAFLGLDTDESPAMRIIGDSILRGKGAVGNAFVSGRGAISNVIDSMRSAPGAVGRGIAGAARWQPSFDFSWLEQFRKRFEEDTPTFDSIRSYAQSPIPEIDGTKIVANVGAAIRRPFEKIGGLLRIPFKRGGSELDDGEWHTYDGDSGGGDGGDGGGGRGDGGKGGNKFFAGIGPPNFINTLRFLGPSIGLGVGISAYLFAGRAANKVLSDLFSVAERGIVTTRELNATWDEGAKGFESYAQSVAKGGSGQGLFKPSDVRESINTLKPLTTELGLTSTQIKEVTNLGTQLANIHGIGLTDAVGALNAGLRGSSDALEKLGIQTSDVYVGAHTGTNGGYTANFQYLTAEEQGQRRLQAIQQQIQAQFRNTQGTVDPLANSVRNLEAQWSSFITTVFGVGPLQAGANALDALRKALEALASPLHDAVTNLASLGTTLAPAASIVGQVLHGGSPNSYITLPGRASGGPVRNKQSYIVGERGPEIFQPDQPGTIIPLGQAHPSDFGPLVGYRADGGSVGKDNESKGTVLDVDWRELLFRFGPKDQPQDAEHILFGNLIDKFREAVQTQKDAFGGEHIPGVTKLAGLENLAGAIVKAIKDGFVDAAKSGKVSGVTVQEPGPVIEPPSRGHIPPQPTTTRSRVDQADEPPSRANIPSQAGVTAQQATNFDEFMQRTLLDLGKFSQRVQTLVTTTHNISALTPQQGGAYVRAVGEEAFLKSEILNAEASRPSPLREGLTKQLNNTNDPELQAQIQSKLTKLDMITDAARGLADAQRMSNRLQLTGQMLGGQTATAQLGALPAQYGLENIQRSESILGTIASDRLHTTPEERAEARRALRRTRLEEPAVERAALLAQGPVIQAQRSEDVTALLQRISQGKEAAATYKLDVAISGGLDFTGNVLSMLTDDQVDQLGENVKAQVKAARAAANNAASPQLTGSKR